MLCLSARKTHWPRKALASWLGHHQGNSMASLQPVHAVCGRLAPSVSFEARACDRAATRGGTVVATVCVSFWSVCVSCQCVCVCVCFLSVCVYVRARAQVCCGVCVCVCGVCF